MKAPCGAEASIKHFKICENAACKVKLDEWNRHKAQTAYMLNRYFSRRDTDDAS